MRNINEIAKDIKALVEELQDAGAYGTIFSNSDNSIEVHVTAEAIENFPQDNVNFEKRDGNPDWPVQQSVVIEGVEFHALLTKKQAKARMMKMLEA